MSTWKEVRIKAEPSNVARRVCAREKQIQEQLLFKMTKKWASFLLKYHFIIAATMGGTSHIKICFAKRERNWPPSNRSQSVVLLLVGSSAQRREQIPSPWAARPARACAYPGLRGAAAGHCPLVADLAWSRRCKESLLGRKFFENAVFLLSRTGSCLLWTP